MAFENLRKALADAILTKSQKAQYIVSTNPQKKDQGEPAPMRYSAEIREKIYKTPIVFTSINAIADQVAKVDWEIVPRKDVLEMFGYTQQTEGKSVAVMTRKEWGQFLRKYAGEDRNKLPKETKDHIVKVYNLLSDPNENMEGFTSIIKKLAIDLKIHDAAALEKIYNGADEIVEIYTAPAPQIRMRYDKNGKLSDPAYVQHDPKFMNKTIAQWSKDEMIYMMLNPLSTSMYGVSPCDVIAQIVATLVNALNYNGSYFESAAMPEGYFTLPGLTEITARRLMEKWEQDIKSKEHKVMFMPEGAKWNQFRFTNVEMQWLQGQKFYMEIVMAVLGVTKHELGFTEGVNRATADNQSFVFKNKSLLPMLGLFADKINQELIGKNGFKYDDVMFVYKNVDLADKETMDKIHDRAVKSGRMTINEAREEAGQRPYLNMGDEPVIATSQGLIFLEQFKMQFEDFKEDRDKIREEADKAGLTSGEMRQRRQQEQASQLARANENNTNRQPKAPPSAPKADEKSKVDESQKRPEVVTTVEGLKELTQKIDKIIEDEKSNSPKSIKPDKRSSKTSSK